MDFYLGVHRPSWLERTDVPLMVSRRVMPKARFPRALGPWVLDSGGFTELNDKGRWDLSPTEYAGLVLRYAHEVGNLRWVAPQDWMCEPFVLERTGLSVREHQQRTVDNFCTLRSITPLVIPVLQGWELGDYRDCLKMYDEAGVDLGAEPVVGVGSVCRRQNMDDASHIMRTLAAEGLSLHGFGFKLSGLRRCRDAMTSADSMAWSLDGRYGARAPLCTHRSCANCLAYALRWREQVVRMDAEAPLF